MSGRVERNRGSISRHADLVRLFAYEPELLRHAPPADVEQAVARTVVTSLRLPVGELQPPAVRSDPFDLGFLVIEGLLIHRFEIVGRRASELIGPGDIVRPWRPSEGAAALEMTVGWEVAEPTRLAILDRRFEQEVSRLPGVIAELFDRLATRSATLAVQLALARLPRLDDRLLALFWHLAERHGRVEHEGVALTLRISQETLAELTSARRQSVNAALRRLRGRGDGVTRGRGRWLLCGNPPRVDLDARVDALTAA